MSGQNSAERMRRAMQGLSDDSLIYGSASVRYGSRSGTHDAGPSSLGGGHGVYSGNSSTNDANSADGEIFFFLIIF